MGRPDQLVASDGTVTVELGVNGDMDQVEQVLRGVPGVTEVERPSGKSDRLWHLTTQADIIPAIVHAVVARDMLVWHVRRLGTDLADVYHRYFEQEVGHDDSR